MKPSEDAARSRLLVALSRLLTEPRILDVDPDSEEYLQSQREIMRHKKMLRGVLKESYGLCLALDREFLSGEGQRVEIGAGTALFKSYDPGVICTDIKAAGHLSGVVDAQNMPFGDCTIRTLYGIHCFHHLPDPRAFLCELERVLIPGGGCVLIEPFHGPIAQWLYPRLFATEHFDKNQEGWRSKLDMTTMHGANQALSYVVFVRDRARLEEDFPQLEIALRKPLNNYLRYVTSGGLYFKQLLPDLSIPFLRLVETLLFPLRSLLALHHVVVVRKKTNVGERA